MSDVKGKPPATPKDAKTEKPYRVFHNLDPADGANPATMPKEMVKADFARRLNREMVKKGWNQSEFARQCEAHTPKGASKITRDLISKYIGAKVIPSPVNMQIILDTLGVKREELLPSGVVPEAGDTIPPIDVRDAGNGMVWLRVNQAVPWELGLKILNLLKGKK